MNWIIKLFRRPSPQEKAAEDVYDAEHSLLEAHKDLEWATARIAAYEARIQRLRLYVTKEI